MIGSLRGVLAERDGAELLVEVGGVGYRVTVTPTTAVGLAEVGTDVFLHIHHVVREDAQTLYGFPTADERRCFDALLGAHGVGPALALAIMGVHPPTSLRQVIADEDVAALCLVPGVGKKTAARLLVELSSRLEAPDAGGQSEVGPVGPDGEGGRAEVREALTSLGYGPDEVRDAVRDLPESGDASDLLRQALQRLAVS